MMSLTYLWMNRGVSLELSYYCSFFLEWIECFQLKWLKGDMAWKKCCLCDDTWILWTDSRISET